MRKRSSGRDGAVSDQALAKTPGLLGILCVMGAVTAFTTQDTAVKWLSGDYPLHQIVFTRAVIALAVTLTLLVPLEGGYRILRTKRLPLHLLRGRCTHRRCRDRSCPVPWQRDQRQVQRSR